MTPDILITLSIILLAMVLFIWNRFSVDTVAILVMVAFMLTGILTPSEGFAGFSNPATLTVGAMFVLSAALFKTGVLNQLGTFLILAGKRSLAQCLLAIMLIAAALSAFINDTAVVALLMPVVIQVAKDANISPSKLLMPLSFGALLGGICTLIGTSTNILVSGIMTDHGLSPIGMFEMTEAGLWFLGAGIIYMVFVGRWLLPNRITNEPLQEQFEMSQYLAEIKLLPSAKSVGYQIAESPLTKELDLEILQLIREDGALDYPMSYTELRAGDTLKVRCDITRLKALAVRQGISVKGDLGEEATGAKLFEMLVIPNSPFVGKSLAGLQFRDTYRGAAVLAIRSRKSVIHDRLGRTILNEGDILLVRSDPQALRRLKDSKGLLLLSEAEKPVIHPGRMAFTLAVVVLVMILAAINIMSIVLSAAAGAILLVVSGMIKPEEAYKAIEWKVLFMLAGILTMGVALYKTGAASLLSNYVTLSIGDYGPQVVLSFFFVLSFLLTNVMSNNATAALLAPIAIVAAESMGVSARPFLMAVTFAASLSFMTPVGYQTNTMILVPGRYKFSDFLRVGTPLNLMMWLLATWMLPRLFPF
jgi:di/tricarboxylate transporter